MEQAIQNVTDAAWTIAPELGILAAAVLLVLLGTFLPMTSDGSQQRAVRRLCLTLATLILLVPLLLTIRSWPVAPAKPHGLYPPPAAAASSTAAFMHDGLSHAVQPASLLAGMALLILMSQRLNPRYPAEHAACLLFAVAGVNLVATANDLIALFVSLELVSIPTYVLLYLSRSDRPALEATLKYFLLSVFSSALLLYGLSFLMGSAGSTSFTAIQESLRQPTGWVNVGMLQIALVFIAAGLGFRIASVPFHFYAPDVFQGTTMPSAAFLAVVPKIAGFVALLRLAWSVLYTDQVSASFANLEIYGAALFAALAILTMTVGNVLALLQTDVRRLLAYSSVAHAGYMLVGLAVPGGQASPNGAQAILFYLLVYAMMTIGVFGVLLMLKREGRSIHSVRDLDGLSVLNPLAALLLAVFLFGLTGLPPTAGFWSKFNLLLVLWKSGSLALWLLAVGLVVNAAIAAWYYLRLIKNAYLAPPADSVTTIPGGEAPALYGAMTLFAVGTIAIFFFPNVLWNLLRGLG